MSTGDRLRQLAMAWRKQVASDALSHVGSNSEIRRARGERLLMCAGELEALAREVDKAVTSTDCS